MMKKYRVTNTQTITIQIPLLMSLLEDNKLNLVTTFIIHAPLNYVPLTSQSDPKCNKICKRKLLNI